MIFKLFIFFINIKKKYQLFKFTILKFYVIVSLKLKFLNENPSPL
jgi:hypothetical protein